MRKEGLKFIFIDRDGVINKDPGGWTKYNYVTDPNDFHFLPGAIEALKLLNKNDILVIIVSNQAGVGRGYFSEGELNRVNSKMLDDLGKKGGSVADVYYCIHKDEDNCNCRKPKTGMFEMAIKKHGIDPKRTYMIGDAKVDIAAGSSLGMKTIFVLSGKTSEVEMRRWDEKPDYVFDNLLEAVKWILNKEKVRSARAFRRQKEEKGR